MAYLRADYHKNDGSDGDSQTRYQLTSSKLFPDEMVAAFNGIPAASQLPKTTASEPAVPSGFIGWQAISASINVIASGQDGDYTPVGSYYGTQKVTISPRSGRSGSPYQVTFLRNKNSYPSSAAGFTELMAAVQAGFFELTVVGTGQGIPAGTLPPTNVTPGHGSGGDPLEDAPASIGGLRYSYVNGTLRFDNTGGLKAISIETDPASSFSTTAPGGATITNGVPFGYSPTFESPWVRKFEMNHQPYSFLVTLYMEVGGSYTFGMTPQVGAVNSILLEIPTSDNGGGGGDPVPITKPAANDNASYGFSRMVSVTT